VAGASVFIDISIHVDPQMTIEEVHQIANEIESSIQQRVPRSVVQIHQEPEDNSR
jgi:divalent metal cation (Fe/Co/Zn/Cd) transporter